MNKKIEEEVVDLLLHDEKNLIEKTGVLIGYESPVEDASQIEEGYHASVQQKTFELVPVSEFYKNYRSGNWILTGFTVRKTENSESNFFIVEVIKVEKDDLLF